MKRIILMTLAVVLLVPACDMRKKERQLEKKQAELNQLEQQLLLREKKLQLQEEELLMIKNKMDSLQYTDSNYIDTNYVVNPDLVGSWSVKMTCTETTCPSSAVGDSKTEQWNISYQSRHVVAKAIAGKRLVRVYSGIYNGNILELIEHRDTASMEYDTRMVVTLRLLDKKTMEGQREIIRENDCKIVYALRMDKQ